jgi:hypothetical protein
MIQPGNYCTHAVASLQKLLDMIPDERSKQDMRAVIYHVRHAVKFVLPDEGVMVEKWGANLPDKFLLPYPIVACEFTAMRSTTTETTNAARKRIALAVQDGNHVRVASIYSCDPDSADPDTRDFDWMLVPWQATIEMHAPTDAAYFNPPAHAAYTPPPNASGLVPIMNVGSLIYSWCQRHTVDKGKQAILDASFDLAHECAVIASFIESLACTNVSTEILPASAKLNHKRAAKKAEPFYDYHVLTIHAGEHARSAGTGLGSHASPRLHLRRGHIRRLQSGKTTFVRPHYVGDPALGVRTKDYIVERS